METHSRRLNFLSGVADYCGVPERIVTEVRNAGKAAHERSLTVPVMTQPRDKGYVFNQIVIRDLIEDFYLDHNKLPRVLKRIATVSQNINYYGV